MLSSQYYSGDQIKKDEIVRIEKMRHAYKILVEELEEKIYEGAS